MVFVHSYHHATRTILAAILVTFVALLAATAAQAYAPGELIWADRVGTSASQAGVKDMTAGPKGAVAIAGSQNLPSEERVPMVAKYNAAGLEWTRTLEGRGEARAVTFDRAGNVYVAATVVSAQYDYDIVLIKYDEDGARQWAATWDGDGTGYVAARHIAVDKSGDLLVVGTKDVLDDFGRYTVPAVVVLRYHRDGTLAWPVAATYEPAAGDATLRTLELSDVALDKADDIYVSGTLFSVWYRVRSAMQGLVLKFSGADGALVASRTDECPPGTESQFASIAVRGSRVAVAGMALDMTDPGAVTDVHGLVAGFDLSLQDAHRRVWDTGETKYETFNDVELDARGDVYVTGSQASTATTDLFSQAVTLKLDRSLSTVLWSAAYAPEAADADAFLIAVDANGEVCVAGVQRTGTPAGYQTLDSQDLLTIKYSRSGVRQWAATWSGGGPGLEGPRGLVLGTKRDVFVAGQSWSTEGALRAALLRYRQ